MCLDQATNIGGIHKDRGGQTRLQTLVVLTKVDVAGLGYKLWWYSQRQMWQDWATSIGGIHKGRGGRTRLQTCVVFMKVDAAGQAGLD